MGMQVRLVSTVRPARDEMSRFVRFHRSMGFSRPILLFDDSDEL
ncbi:hypothetical protein J2X73_003927 [Novosphingobium sp. 1748]|nr:hypothetical protein [Novosphingobium sp. 1748]